MLECYPAFKANKEIEKKIEGLINKIDYLFSYIGVTEREAHLTAIPIPVEASLNKTINDFGIKICDNEMKIIDLHQKIEYLVKKFDKKPKATRRTARTRKSGRK